MVKKRTMRVAVGAGQHLKDADVSVYLHADFVKQADGTVRFVSGGNDKDSNYIYRGISDDQSLSLEDVESSFQVWHPQSKWMIPLRGCDTLEVSDLLQRLMDKNATPNQESKAYDKKKGTKCNESIRKPINDCALVYKYGLLFQQMFWYRCVQA